MIGWMQYTFVVTFDYADCAFDCRWIPIVLFPGRKISAGIYVASDSCKCLAYLSVSWLWEVYVAMWTYLMPVSGNNATMGLLSSHTQPRARLGAPSLHIQVSFYFETMKQVYFIVEKHTRPPGPITSFSSSIHQSLQLRSYLCTSQTQQGSIIEIRS